MRFQKFFRSDQYKRVFAISLVICFCIILPFTPPSTKDPREINDNDFFSSVTASRSLNSFQPKVLFSNSGIFHLFFLHEEYESSEYLYVPYHMYKLNNGSWSNPTRIDGPSTDSISIYDYFSYIKLSEMGFIAYYLTSSGVYKKEYNELNNSWTDAEQLFGREHLTNYLNISTQQIHQRWHSFYSLEDNSFFVVWSFSFLRGENQSHEYENFYFASRVDLNGSFVSQQIFGRTASKSDKSIFLSFNNTIYLYSSNYGYRALYHPNGTWSNWQLTGLNSVDMTLSANRFLIRFVGYSNHYWTITDLNQENLTLKTMAFPPSNFDPKRLFGATFKPNSSMQTDLKFSTAFISNQTIELWEYNYNQNSWQKVSIFVHPVNDSLFNEYFDIDLVCEDSQWHLFWDQRISVEEGPTEIFTISYDLETSEWSAITQLTDTNTITGDYHSVSSSFPSFLVIISVLGIIVFLTRKYYCKKYFT